jgi:chemotaxis methyl-accepting protein methylase
LSTGNLDFEQFRVFLEKACGILLGENKQYLVSSRLNKLMEQQGIKSLGELVQPHPDPAAQWFARDGGGRDDDQRNPVVS